MQNTQSLSNQQSLEALAPQQISQNNSKFFVVVAVSILLTGIFTGSIVYFRQKSANEKIIGNLEQKINFLESQILVMDKNKTLQPTITLAPTLEPNLTNDWLAYSNSNIDYTFKYPPNVSLAEENIIKLSLWGPTQKENTEFYDGISLVFSLPFKIESVPLSEYVDQEIERSRENADILEGKAKINIAGIEGFTYMVQGLGAFKYIYLQSPDKTWTVRIINGTNDPTNQGYEGITDQILSTFKFTD